MSAEEHPGWAIRFEDGEWLAIAHGIASAKNPFFAEIFSSKEEAEKFINECKVSSYQVVEAWPVLVAQLRFQIEGLEKANSISPEKFRKIWSQLDRIKDDLDCVIDIFK